MTQPERDPLDPDEQAFLDLHAARAFPLAEHGRPIGRRDIPHMRTIEDVDTTLEIL